MSNDSDKWQQRYQREKAARVQAEQLLEHKSSQLFIANELLEQKFQLESSKLRNEEKKFTALFHSSIDGIILYNNEGVILDANPTLCQLLKVKVNQIIGTNIREFYPKEFLAHAIKAKDELSNHGHTRFEVPLRCADHSYVPTEVSATKFEVDEKTIIQGIIRDTTDRNKIALDLERATESAIKANEAKSLFLAAMSHEIRTPLNGILGFTDILIQSDASDEQRQHLNLIKKSGNILLSIINDILDFSRVESQQVELEMVDYSLTECIEETLDIHAHTAAAKNVDLLYSVDSDVPLELNGDTARIKQIILNLVSNALKFTSEGSVVVRASRPDKKTIEISVTDTGIGFESELKSQLFQPFIQADASTTRKYGGTGLGLAICKQLIDAMEGSIDAKSSLGHGASFFIRFPYLPALQQLPRDSANNESSKLNGLNVLVIDDHAINLDFMQARLNKWGCKVTSVQSSKEASKLSNEELLKHDLILSDMLMPNMDGLMLARELRRKLGHQTPPMILATSSRNSSDKTEALKIGFKNVIYKPIKESELITNMIDAVSCSTSLIAPSRSPEKTNLCCNSDYALIVEDNPINAKLAKLLIERIGLTAHIAHNGKEALAALVDKQVYSVIFMDIQMPIMDGLVTSTKIRKGEAGSYYTKTPIVAMTANALAEDKKRCLEAGMNHYLSKPINTKELIKVLNKLGIIS
ncbi:MAG: response regulator [Rubritalea sp.]|uniref:PAS domain-containing hybrid sensor histidine kinase/response regulator n=1 Tax=Rubritalea sp. TaxID=2109375 RepID=UPI003242CB9D